MIKNYKKGFTLIELLVVIAIIGVLAAVVLSATNSARAKGGDAAVKSNLANSRAQAEIFYDAGYTYTNICSSSTSGSIYNAFVAGATAGGATTFQVNGASTTDSVTAKCNNSATAWAIEAPLKSTNVVNSSSGTDFWCVDSTGKSQLNNTAGISGATDYTC